MPPKPVCQSPTARTVRKEERRRAWHQGRVDQARTPKERLWAACGWLIAEAWRRGRLEDATERVLTAVDEIREEDQADVRGY